MLRMTKTLSKTNSTENWNEFEKCNHATTRIYYLARQQEPQTQRLQESG